MADGQSRGAGTGTGDTHYRHFFTDEAGKACTRKLKTKDVRALPCGPRFMGENGTGTERNANPKKNLNPFTNGMRETDKTPLPLVLMGVYPDIERTLARDKYYNYIAHGEIEHFSEVALLYMSRPPAHKPIVPNGS
ncbi:hypothetical protein PoB_001145500 [Plakobranchus ocellatus]|uniref:Uncharacterized protein n=1 Tax=Plakobranchus ocellatus TaxID=259542 RepID=A0AAV3YP86_9GAST|nr:hypothetical protein PoB_001145500 [Plakobranchus ocellatus]